MVTSKRRVAFTAAVVWLTSAFDAQAEQKVVFGLLHAHTSYSDGSGTPRDAFKMARGAGLDFFAVTPHNHDQAEAGAKDRKDGVMIALQPELYNGSGEVTVRPINRPQYKSVSVTRASAQESTSSYVALFGQEFSTISSGNHVNVLDFPEVLRSPNGNFKALLSEVAAKEGAGVKPFVIQLNHPDVHADHFYGGRDQKAVKKMHNDYGFDDFGEDYAKVVQALDRNVQLIEVLSGPAMKTKRVTDFSYQAHEDDYYFYLTQGLHVSPSVGHDNHYETWGTTTDARMGAFVDGNGKDALLDAFRANRTFATEDKDLQVSISINGRPMGSSLVLHEDDDLKIEVTVLDDTDGGEPVDVQLIHGEISPATRSSLREWKAGDGLEGTVELPKHGVAAFDGFVASGGPEFFYARVTQADQDRAWSGPIWINDSHAGAGTPAQLRTTAAPAAETFVWTTSPTSTLFHNSWCRVVQQIKTENRASGTQPPSGRKKHSCRPANEEADH